MGIQALMMYLKKKCPQLIVEHTPQFYKGRTLAIDAPSTIYKFLAKTITSNKNAVNIPMDSQGNQTGHLIGIMYRALLCMEMGIKQIWVFDGTPPAQKLAELRKRKLKKQEASQKIEKALQEGDFQEAAKQSQRSIRISPREVTDAMQMLNFMGIPTVSAFGEAQAQCAWLTKQKMANGVISEDLDTLVFGVDFLVRNFARNGFSTQIEREKILQGLGMTQDQFVDFCILCGCDYTSKIAGIGPVWADKLIKQQGCIQGVMAAIQANEKWSNRFKIPQDFDFITARSLFQEPLVNTQISLPDTLPKQINYPGLQQFLRERNFDQKRVQKWITISKQYIQENQSKI